MLLSNWLLPLKNRPVSSRRSRRRRRTLTVPAVEQMEPRVLLCASHGLQNDALPSPAGDHALFAASDVDMHGGRVDGDVELAEPSRAGRNDDDLDFSVPHGTHGGQLTTLSGSGSGSGSGGGPGSGSGTGAGTMTALDDPDASVLDDAHWYEIPKDSPPMPSSRSCSTTSGRTSSCRA